MVYLAVTLYVVLTIAFYKFYRMCSPQQSKLLHAIIATVPGFSSIVASIYAGEYVANQEYTLDAVTKYNQRILLTFDSIEEAENYATHHEAQGSILDHRGIPVQFIYQKV